MHLIFQFFILVIFMSCIGEKKVDVDMNKNNIPDNVDEYINSLVVAEDHNHNELLKNAFRQYSRAIIDVLKVDTLNKNSALLISNKEVNALKCILFIKFDVIGDYKTASRSHERDVIKAKIFNNQSKLSRYKKYQSLLFGNEYGGKESYKHCEFKIRKKI